jgi:hypothetical protein
MKKISARVNWDTWYMVCGIIENTINSHIHNYVGPAISRNTMTNCWQNAGNHIHNKILFDDSISISLFKCNALQQYKDNL